MDSYSQREDLDEAVEALKGRAQLRAVLSSLGGVPILRLDRDGQVRGCLVDAELQGKPRFHGVPVERLVGRALSEFVVEAERASLTELIERTFDSGEVTRGEFALEMPAGDFTDEVHLAPLRDAKQQVTEVVCLAWDVTQRVRAERRASELASYDSLTRLPNRRRFREELDRQIETAAELGRTMALCFIDLDRFKQVNDTFGHAAGDELLATVAQNLTTQLRAVDVVGRGGTSEDGESSISRIGGDEFTVLLTKLRLVEDAALVAERMLDAVRRPVASADLEVPCTASIGIALYPKDGSDADTLIHSADLAMYEAKRSGGDCARFFDHATGEAAMRRSWVETQLRRAIPRSELRPFFQPIVNGVTGELAGAEALLRWTCEDGSSIAPVEFIAVAESTGMIRELGRDVLQQVATQLRDWKEAGVRMTVGINVSPNQLRQRAFPAQVAAIVDAAGIDHEQVQIEITETAIVEDSEQCHGVLRALANDGFRLILDDFGTGYSSLSLLRALPIHSVKIDREFVSGVGEVHSGRSIAEAIVAMAHALGVGVIAEGVETEAQARRMVEAGCNHLQGFLYSPAIEPEKLIESISRGWPAVSALRRK